MTGEHFDTFNNVYKVIEKIESNAIWGLNVSYGVPFVQNMYTRFIGVSPKWNEKFSEFKESDQLLKHKSG